MLTRHCHTFSQMTLEVLSIGIQSKTIDIRLIEALVARVFPCTVPSHVERVEEGVSTYVYRIYRGNELFYLRVLPEVNASFAPEVYVHEMLRAKNVKVPEVVYFEHYNEAVQRSVMVTIEHLEEDLAFLGERVLSTREIEAIRGIVDRFGAWLDIEQSWLAHGDFDATHIYQEHGCYTGIIDFGEIRGGDPFYDLGHFQMHDGETLPARVLPYLLEGYKEVVQLPPDYEQRIHFSSLLIATRALTRSMKKRSIDFRGHAGFWSIKHDIEVLQHGGK